MADDKQEFLEIGAAGDENALISFKSSLGKQGEIDQNNPNKPAESVTEVERRLANVSGTSLHYIMHKLITRRLVPELNYKDNSNDDLEVNDYSKRVFLPSENSNRDQEMMGIVKKLPDIKIADYLGGVSNSLRTYFEKRWDQVLKFQSAFIEGLSKHPYLNKDNIVVVSEVRLPVLADNLTLLAKSLRNRIIDYRLESNEKKDNLPQPKTVLPISAGDLSSLSKPLGNQNINYKIDVQPREFHLGGKSNFSININDLLDRSAYDDIKETELKKDKEKRRHSGEEIMETITNPSADNDPQNKLQDFLFRVLIQKSPVEKYFPDLEKRLSENKVDFHSILLNISKKEFDLNATDLLNKNLLNRQEFETLLALRVVSQAIHEANFFIGGRMGGSKIESAEELREILLDIGADTSNITGKEMEEVRKNLPKKETDYREPSGIRPDALVFEMPEKMDSDQKDFISEFRTFLSNEYEKYHNPPLLINNKFYEMLDQGVAMGMKLKTLELKTTLNRIEDPRKFRKEMFYYAISMMQGLVAYRKWKGDEGYDERYLKVLHDPILNAHQGSEVLVVEMTSENRDVGAKFDHIPDHEGIFSGEYPDKNDAEATKKYRERYANVFRKEYQSLLKRIFVSRNVKVANSAEAV